MHLIQIMFYKPKNLPICFSPFITKEVTVLTCYTHCLSRWKGLYFTQSINSNKDFSQKCAPKLYLHGNI